MDNEARLANLRKMAEADPENELAHFSLGKLYFELGSSAAAVDSLRRALELNPKHSLAHQILGEALLAHEDRDAAVDVLRRGVILAHEKGELMPRDRMLELLDQQGAERPRLDAVKTPSPPPSTAGEGGGDGGFVCRRCNRPSLPLKAAPFRSQIGEKILATICAGCWKEWMLVSVKVINEFRLNLMSPRDSEVYDQHMKEFLGL